MLIAIDTDSRFGRSRVIALSGLHSTRGHSETPHWKPIPTTIGRCPRIGGSPADIVEVHVLDAVSLDC